MTLTHNDLRARFLKFFENRDHLIVPSAPLVPIEDKSTLFVTAGVQPIIPYLRHEQRAPASKIANTQKCLRTNDIDIVGDETHLTSFEMLGSWSIGDYGKEQAISYAYDFLTSQEGLNLSKDRIWVTAFKGGNGLPQDEETAIIWKSIGIPEKRITYLGVEDNWWSMGEEGLCGPDTEIFYDTKYPKKVPEGENPGNDPTGRFVEIWNTVFMSYERKNGNLTELPTRNIDEGAGLERLLYAVNGQTIYETSCFKNSYDLIRSKKNDWHENDERKSRIVADHLRTSLFILSERPKIYPAANDQGYILRRLIRSAVQNGRKLGLDDQDYEICIRNYAQAYQEQYPEMSEDIDVKVQLFNKEKEKFEKILIKAPKIWDQFTNSFKKEVPPELAFKVITEQGVPLGVIEDLMSERKQSLDIFSLNNLMNDHKQISKTFKKVSLENKRIG